MGRTLKLKTLIFLYSAFRVVLLYSDIYAVAGPAQFAEDTVLKV